MKTNSSKNNTKIDLWKSSTQLKLLEFFFRNPTEDFYAKQVSDRTGMSVGAANEHLKKLLGSGLLNRKKEGRMSFYTLDRDNPIVKHLKIAHNLSKSVCEELRKIGRELDLEIYLYGSVARGEDKEGSDWDILVIGDVGSAKLQDKLEVIDIIEINTSIFTRSEWNKMEEDDPAFYERVEHDKIRLI
ncbi:MAG: nucleotidyltransferase domain-containing protein [Candidatus Aenigmatarchaeota archaeon]